jgi:AcrR family transcriptional regulator
MTVAAASPAETRLQDVVTAATHVFAVEGYRRTQMATIARELGASPGTIYNYVEGKQALFFLVLRRCFGDKPGAQPPSIPVPTPSAEDIAAWFRGRLDFVDDFPRMEQALRRRRARDINEELIDVVGELYDVLERMSDGLEVLERSMTDWPQLLAEFLRVRQTLLDRVVRYLSQRLAVGQIRAVPDVEAAARVLIESTSWLARRRSRDPQSAHIDSPTARSTVTDILANGLAARDAASSR